MITLSLIFNVVLFLIVCVLFKLYRSNKKENKKANANYSCLLDEFKKSEKDKNKMWHEKEDLHSKYCDLVERNKKLEKDYLKDMNFSSINEYKEMIRTITDMYERQHGCNIEKLLLVDDLNSVVRHKDVQVVM